MWHLHKFAGRSAWRPGKVKAMAMKNGMWKGGGGQGSAGLLCRWQVTPGIRNPLRHWDSSVFESPSGRTAQSSANAAA